MAVDLVDFVALWPLFEEEDEDYDEYDDGSTAASPDEPPGSRVTVSRTGVVTATAATPRVAISTTTPRRST